MLEHLDDIASDMSAFHRVDDVTVMGSRSFFRLVFRLPAYQGVMAARVTKQEQERDDPVPQRTPAASMPQRSAAGAVVAATADVLRTHPAFSQMPGEKPVVSFVKGGDGGGGR